MVTGPPVILGVLPPLALLTAVVVLAALGLVLLDAPDRPAASAGDAQRAALTWVGAEIADAPRRDGDTWEVDVRRDDGSLVEVTLGEDLQLRELDEELGPNGDPSHDELAGPARDRAIRAARRVAGDGAVTSVEREDDGTVEVNVQQDAGTILEVELDPSFRVADTDVEELGDE